MAGGQHTPEHGNGIRSWLGSRTGLIFLGFLAIAGFYLVTEHTAHTLGALPYILFLLCPLLHLFMHGGHGNHGEQADHAGHAGHQHDTGGRQ